jgi:outer membrane biosynthesis protein TonB
MYSLHDYRVRSGIKKTAMALTLSGSAACHFLFFAMIFFFPGFSQTYNVNPPVIDINLVSITETEIQAPDFETPEPEPDMDISDSMETSDAMAQPAPETLKQNKTLFEPKKFKPLTPIEQPKTYEPLIPNPEMIQPEKTTEPKPIPEPEPKPIQRPEIKKIQPIKRPPIDKPQKPETPKVKKSLKKKTIKKQQIVRNKEKRHINDTLRKLQQDVRIQEAKQRIQQSGSKKSDVELIDIYKAKIISNINKNWARPPRSMLKGTEKATLLITIMRSGRIIENQIQFEKKSGNTYFDDSAKNAVIKSNPLPPLPIQYLQPVYGPVGLNFTDSGLK